MQQRRTITGINRYGHSDWTIFAVGSGWCANHKLFHRESLIRARGHDKSVDSSELVDINLIHERIMEMHTAYVSLYWWAFDRWWLVVGSPEHLFIWGKIYIIKFKSWLLWNIWNFVQESYSFLIFKTTIKAVLPTDPHDDVMIIIFGMCVLIVSPITFHSQHHFNSQQILIKSKLNSCSFIFTFIALPNSNKSAKPCTLPVKIVHVTPVSNCKNLLMLETSAVRGPQR